MVAKTKLVLTVLTLFLVSIARAQNATPTAEVKVMSFNVYGGNGLGAVFGPGSWFSANDPPAARRLMVMDVVNNFAPDILGLQETGVSQNTDLVQNLTQFGWYGIGRDDGDEGGEYATIMYRADRFDLLDQGSFWLSTTPDVPGTVFAGAGSIRMASWVKLYDHESFQNYFVLNTHLDNVSSTANRLSAELIRQKFHELAGGLPIIMTGDFNELETSTTTRTLLGELPTLDFPLYDSYREAFPVRASNERTYHFSVFDGSTSGPRIDYVLHSGEFETLDASIIRTNYGGTYPSDHYPVTATLSIAVVPEISSMAMVAVAAGAGIVILGRRKPG